MVFSVRMGISTTVFLKVTKQNQRQSFSIANNKQKKSPVAGLYSDSKYRKFLFITTLTQKTRILVTESYQAEII
ncbi:hypothetical protein DVG78_07410 [Runella aurantiaca]|uniref:Uncharacterized protein n=1 Tax=Runella aurantiaca TaxID=2282308 RepID=A0A369IA91_9BACT|nr:hypothetical protein DVG78_07410 [Runella aurantiaca]